MKKPIKRILSMALAAVMCLGLSATAFAADAQTDAQAAVTKELQMAAGTETPTASFSFTATPKSVDGSTDTADAPGVTVQKAAFTQGDAGTTADGLKKVVKESAVSFGTFPHAGVYVYTVKETGMTDSGKDTYVNSKAEYEMSVYVGNKTGGGTYIISIVVVPTKTDNGDAGEGGSKVDPKPGTSSTTGQGNGFRFINQFKQYAGPVVPDPEPGPGPGPDPDPNNYFASAVISKEVTGNMGDLTKAFDFSFTVKKSALETENTYQYVKYAADGTASVEAAPFGEAVAVTLKHGEHIDLANLLVGTVYTVTETDTDANYTATVNGAQGKTLGDTAIPAAGSSAKFVNDYSTVIPTGLMVNSLPFVLMTVLAMGGVGLLALVRVRKLRED